MKKWWMVLCLLLLGGCASADRAAQELDNFRSRIASQVCSFSVRVQADYIDTREAFSMKCTYSPEKILNFEMTAPQELAGIRGTVSGTEGKLHFQDTVIGIRLMAGDRISPLSGPWMVLQALTEGPVHSFVQEDRLLHVSGAGSFEEDAPEAELWLEGDVLRSAEISWKGRRILTLEFSDFTIAPDSAGYNSPAGVGQ